MLDLYGWHTCLSYNNLTIVNDAKSALNVPRLSEVWVSKEDQYDALKRDRCERFLTSVNQKSADPFHEV